MNAAASNDPGQSSAHSDSAILARVAAGDVEALGTLYDRHAPSLMRFARRLERNEAEDIVQTVFMRVLRLAASFDREVPSARPWLFAITARVAQERRRSMRRWLAARLRFGEQRFKATGAILDTRPDLDRALALLTSAKRTVLLLAEVEGFSCDEIATMLSIPVGTVWTRLHHARLELRRFHQQDGT
jgi:RNA polymerase sigma factor (sigma-70 family)